MIWAYKGSYRAVSSAKKVILEREREKSSLSMSMESIGAKIAFVRGGFGSGEMQKEGEITISRYLTQANLKRRRAPMHI